MKAALLFLMTCACVLAGCASGGSGGLAANAGAVRVADQLGAPSLVDSTIAQRDYHIGPRDIISVEVFGAEDLKRRAEVDASGNFQMPLVGHVQAAGLTASELSKRIADRLRGRVVKDPQVSVSVEEVRSQQVTIDGAVRQPGVYPVMARMTLQRVVALAKGMDEYARPDQIVIFRTVDGQARAAQFDLRAVREGRLPDPEIYGNDVIIVGDNARRRNLTEVLRSLPILGVFTPLVR